MDRCGDPTKGNNIEEIIKGMAVAKSKTGKRKTSLRPLKTVIEWCPDLHYTWHGKAQMMN
jgi:hypothetical protein